jgi:hypothetical protein
MSKSAKSVLIYGVYLAINGLLLLSVPNVLLSSLRIEPTTEVWIRLAGILLMAVSVYYFIGAKQELAAIMTATAFIRFSIPLFFAAFVLLDFVSPGVMVIAAIDFLGGAWTFLMLKKERHFARSGSSG